MNAYLLLFLTAFGAATVLPFYSEFLLVGQVVKGYDPIWLWLAATTGNTLGAGVNWWLGAKLVSFADHKWFPARKRDLDRAERWFNKYGIWTLLLSWMPIGGDALTFVAGMMHVRMLPFFTLVAIGKGIRFMVVILGAMATPGLFS